MRDKQEADDVGRILDRAKLRIAGLVLEVVPASEEDSIVVLASHVPFLVDEGKSDCTLVVRRGVRAEGDWGDRIFTSGGLWSLYWNGRSYTLPLVSPLYGPEPYRVARFNADFSRGDLYERESGPVAWLTALGNTRPGAALMPLEHPLDELIFVNLLSRGRGLCIHACGLSDQRRAVAFCGVSGAGKSTTAGLWKRELLTILSDDRLILRPEGTDIWCWGTPWHGDARASSPLGAPLRKLYFLKHGLENRITPLSAAEAALRLTVCCFPTFYDAVGMASTLRIISLICTSVPCAELQFVPDQRVVDLVRRDALA